MAPSGTASSAPGRGSGNKPRVLGDFSFIAYASIRIASYNESSAYVDLDRWFGAPCSDCGSSVAPPSAARRRRELFQPFSQVSLAHFGSPAVFRTEHRGVV